MRNENIFNGKQKAPGVKFWLLVFLTLWLRSVLKLLPASVSPVSAINIQCQPHREVVTTHGRVSDKGPAQSLALCSEFLTT